MCCSGSLLLAWVSFAAILQCRAISDDDGVFCEAENTALLQQGRLNYRSSAEPVHNNKVGGSVVPAPGYMQNASKVPANLGRDVVEPFVATAGSKLQLTCEGAGFLDCFNFFTAADPTSGYVNYVDEATATSLGMIHVLDNKSIQLGSIVGESSPAKSIRLESKNSFNSGLFVIDIAHMPTGESTWPAWWLYGPNWPASGEIDIIEAVNGGNAISTLHTTAGCSMSTVPRITNGGNCNAADGHDGCGLEAPPNSGSAPFNARNGGVYAMRWGETDISMWFFAHDDVPSDIGAEDPNPDSWGTPYVSFPIGEASGCPSSHFSNLQFVVNLDFCGAWAGSVFPAMGGWPGGEQACEGYVGDSRNIEELADAYWLINSIKLYDVQA